MTGTKGPLAGINIIEMVGIGPAPFACMILADLGATVIRIDRLSDAELGMERPAQFDFAARGRPSVALDQPGPSLRPSDRLGPERPSGAGRRS